MKDFHELEGGGMMGEGLVGRGFARYIRGLKMKLQFIILIVAGLLSTQAFSEEADVLCLSLNDVAADLSSKNFFTAPTSNIHDLPVLTAEFFVKLRRASLKDLRVFLNKNYPGWEENLKVYRPIFKAFEISERYTRGFQHAIKFDGLFYREGPVTVHDLMGEWTREHIETAKKGTETTIGEFVSRFGEDRISFFTKRLAPKLIPIAEEENLRMEIAFYLAEKAMPGFIHTLMNDHIVSFPRVVGVQPTISQARVAGPTQAKLLEFVQSFDSGAVVDQAIVKYFRGVVMPKVTKGPAISPQFLSLGLASILISWKFVDWSRVAANCQALMRLISN